MMNGTKKALWGLLTTLALWAPGCDAPEEDAAGNGGEAGKADLPVSDAEIIGTSNNNLKLLFGWDFLHDSSTPTACVESLGGPGKPVLVGQPDGAFDMAFVTTREELASQLELDLAVEATVNGVGVNSKTHLMNKFSRNRRAATYLLKVKSQYAVRTRHEVELSDSGLDALDNGLSDFFRVCGTHHVSGLRYGAELYVMITFKAENDATANELKQDLGVDAGSAIPGVSASSSVAAKLVQNSMREGVTVDVSVSVRGFGNDSSSDPVISRLVNDGITPDTFMLLDGVFSSMKTSVAKDACRDAGRDECWTAQEKADVGCGGSDEACGYFYNDVRNSVVTGVSAGMYNAMSNWSEPEDGEFQTALRRVQDNEDFLRSLGGLKERMNKVYYSEIRPFAESRGTDKALYNLQPEAEPAQSVDELVDIADEWANEFLPPSTDGTSSLLGVSYQVVEKDWKDCFQATSDDQLFACGPGDVNVLINSINYQMIEAKLLQYHDQGRIVPLGYWASNDALVNFNAAKSVCAEESNFGSRSNPIAGRLPTKDEALRLAPLVASGPLDWSDADISHAIWYSSSLSDGCGDGMMSIMLAAPGEDPTFVCAEEGTVLGDEVLPVCVPQSGPAEEPQAP